MKISHKIVIISIFICNFIAENKPHNDMTTKDSINTYLKDIAQVSLLTDEQERTLAAKIIQGDNEALNQLISANLKSVVSLAKQYTGQGLGLDDLISEGNFGLMKAATHFRPEFNKRFVVFAAPTVRSYIEKAIEQQTSLYAVPKNEASAAEVRRSKAVSVDAPIPAGSQNNYNLLHVIENTDAEVADHKVEYADMTARLEKVIGILGEREQRVISLLYGIGQERHTMAEAALLLGLKRERVRQVRDQALRKLNKVKMSID